MKRSLRCAIGAVLRWGVMLDGPLGEGLWGIASEVDDVTSTAREQSFALQTGAQNETYYLTHCGRFGSRVGRPRADMMIGARVFQKPLRPCHPPRIARRVRGRRLQIRPAGETSFPRERQLDVAQCRR